MSRREGERYSRQIPLIGVEGQVKLKKSSVLVVGVGGLGSVASFYLAAAGVGRIFLLDNGIVEESNLQRQIMYTIDDIGKPKAIVAAERLKRLNPYIDIEPIQEDLTESLLSKIIRNIDVIVDCLDNWEGRMIIDRVAHRYGKPFIHAGVYGFYGQLTVIIPGKTPCLRCIFPKKPKIEESPLPIFPTTPGVLGVLEANEALKLLLGRDNLLANKLLIYDGSIGLFEVVEITMGPDCPACKEYY